MFSHVVIIIMRRATILLILILDLMTGPSSCDDVDIFSSNNDLTFDEVESNLSDGLFTNEAGSDIGDNLFDDFLAVDDSSCPSSFTLSRRRIRIRSDSCSATQSGSNPERYLDVRTDEDVKKYWCSESNYAGFSNIPVCNILIGAKFPSNAFLHPDLEFSEVPAGFLTLTQCRISKFYSHLRRISSGQGFAVRLRELEVDKNELGA